MNGYLYRYGRACDERLLAVLIAQQPDDMWIYLEHDYPLHGDYAVYLKFKGAAVEPERYSAGRIFNAHYEIRWQQLSDGISLQLLCEDEMYSQDGFVAVETFMVKPRSMYLWGTHTSSAKLTKHEFMVQGDVWVETRIPRPLEYPVHDMQDGQAPPHVQINTHCYHQQDTDILRTTRWLALEGLDR